MKRVSRDGFIATVRVWNRSIKRREARGGTRLEADWRCFTKRRPELEACCAQLLGDCTALMMWDEAGVPRAFASPTSAKASPFHTPSRARSGCRCCSQVRGLSPIVHGRCVDPLEPPLTASRAGGGLSPIPSEGTVNTTPRARANVAASSLGAAGETLTCLHSSTQPRPRAPASGRSRC